MTRWNGETGDSTILYADEIRDSAWVRVTSGKCTQLTIIEVQTLLGEIVFPPWVSDTVHLCHPDENFRLRSGMDSLVIDGTNWYFQDDDIVLDEGFHVMTGFYNSCSAEREIWVDIAEDLGEKFSKEYNWCPEQNHNLMLPADSAGLQFSWSDGTSSRIREISGPGSYSFEITDLMCTYQGAYELIIGDDCNGECTVSIPNAVSPNGDGWNDGLEIFPSAGCGALISIRLFDKWGGKIYTTKESRIAQEVWVDLPAGMYLVQVDYKDARGRARTETEAVMVVK